jgi:glycosyltransferase involved in cell wall biosynthesis
VLFVSPSFAPAYGYGGPVVSSRELGAALVGQGCAVRVLTTDAAGGGARLEGLGGTEQEMEGMRVRYCRRTAGEDFSVEMMSRLKGEVAWADAVLLNGVFSAPVPAAMRACRTVGRGVVWFPRGSLQMGRVPLKKRVWLGILGVVRPERLHLQFTSEEEARESEWAFAGVGRSVTPHGVRVGPAAEGKGEGDVRLAYVGRLHPIKGLEMLVAGLGEARRRGRRVELVLVGEGEAGYEAALRAAVDREGIGDAVTFAGAVYGEREKWRILNGCDGGVMVSERENFGMAGAEALAAGLALVVTENLPWRGVGERGCGYVAERSVESLAGVLSRMERGEMREMGRRGRAWMEAEYSWESAARRVRERLEGVRG